MNNKVIPCALNEDLKKKIEELADVIKIKAHTLGDHGLTETEFYKDGLFQGAIERIRGQFSATMRDKREFVALVLDYMQDEGYVGEWEPSGDDNRHDYTVKLPNGRVCVIEVKGCLDGNNTTIFERPDHAQEFVIWSLCSNAGADPRKNVWSGIHTRLGCEVIKKADNHVDGLVVWDWLCGTRGRPCPKHALNERFTVVGQYRLTPPCIYLFPGTRPHPKNNPNPEPHAIEDVSFLFALHKCFKGRDEELNRVHLEVSYVQESIARKTSIEREGEVQKTSKMTPIRRK